MPSSRRASQHLLYRREWCDDGSRSFGMGTSRDALPRCLNCACRDGSCVEAAVPFQSVAQTCMMVVTSTHIAPRRAAAERLNGLTG
jgi:hypothetical protein